MQKIYNQKTRELLDAIKADFPRRKREAESMLLAQGLNIVLTYDLSLPEQAVEIITFKKNTYKKLSPMLAERYAFASTITRALDIWPDLAAMRQVLTNSEIRTVHRSMRKYWPDSAPALFTDSNLSLFGYTIDVPDSIVYSAWGDAVEPQIFYYSGIESAKFDDLNAYLEWCLKRE